MKGSPILKQRRTQSPTYWQELFQVSSSDIEFITNRILEENRIFSLDEIGLLLVRHYCAVEEQEFITLQDGHLYQPKEHFEVGEKVMFAQMGFAAGKVTAVRPGKHPHYDKFSVMQVTFNESLPPREFVADFDYDHALNSGSALALTDGLGVLPPETIYETQRETIRATIKKNLDAHKEFIRFQDNYFLRDLLPDIQEGLFNIADAAIDIAGRPLPVDQMVEQMGLSENGHVTEMSRFLVNCRLAADSRFDDVGPKGQVLWYLDRLQPPEATAQPIRLQGKIISYKTDSFDSGLQGLLAQIDDELTPIVEIATIDTTFKTISLTLTHPHWRSGTLPLTPKTQAFFPISYYNPVLFEFIDGRTGNSFPGWVVLQYNYVFGLEKWYRRNVLPVGTYLHLKRTNNPTQVVIDYEAVRSQRDWVRQATADGSRLIFRMNQEAIGCKYDELMMISEANPDKIDTLWQKIRDQKTPVFDLLCSMFPELSKLSPQSTVHVKTLYTAVNILRRTSPGEIFHELTTQPCFLGMEHGYWSYNPKLKD